MRVFEGSVERVKCFITVNKEFKYASLKGFIQSFSLTLEYIKASKTASSSIAQTMPGKPSPESSQR